MGSHARAMLVAATVTVVLAAPSAQAATPPTVLLAPNTPEPGGQATLRGFVNPGGSALGDCHFTYGLDESFSQSAACEPTPGAVGEAVAVEAHLTNLTPGAIYSYRLIADSGGSPVASPVGRAAALREPSEGACPNQARREEEHAGNLPACRAYELVSPPDKNGGDVLLTTERTRVAADGDAYGFASLAGFGDTHELGVATDYLSERSASPEPGDHGWSTHGIDPPQQTLTESETVAGEEPLYVGPYSSDMQRGVFSATSPLSEDENVEHVPNLYLRGDLRAAGLGSYRLLTACPLCAEESAPLARASANALAAARPYFAAASADLERILFESRRNLTVDAPEQPAACSLEGEGFLGFVRAGSCGYRLYESDHGTLRLAGRIPPPGETSCDDSSVSSCVAADASVAGEGANHGVLTPDVISDGSDGHSRAFFTQPTNEEGETLSQTSGFGAVAVNQSTEGNLFVRTDGHETVELNASERGEADTFHPAAFFDASADGAHAFFTTTEALTDDAPIGGQKVYAWSATADAEGHHLTLISRDEEPADGTEGSLGVIGASRDGRSVYFMAMGALVPGMPPGGGWIYLWHDGEIKAVAPLPQSEVQREQLATNVVFNLHPQQARVSPDGSRLLFSSISGEGLTGYDHGECEALGHGCRELYLYDAETESLECASCNPSGAPAQGMATDFLGENTIGGTRAEARTSQALSEDGSRVFFSSPDALVPQDTNGVYDAYEYDAETGQVTLLSSGTSSSGSYVANSDPEGANVFILTNQRLLGWDTDGSYDFYDARTGGGFPEPPPVPAACGGDLCRSPVQPAPSPAPVGSTLEEPGNPRPHRRRKHRRHHHRKHHHRAARHHQGAGR